jgi:hypothetical protein
MGKVYAFNNETFYKGKLRYFELSEKEKAKEWIINNVQETKL